MTDATLTPETPPALTESAHQTAGPYWHLVDFPEWADTTRHFPDPTVHGQPITVTGRITDGAGTPMGDALVEIWHASPDGTYPDPQGPDTQFQGFGRCAAAPDGTFRFTTLKPGPVRIPGANAVQAPHIAISIFARGLMRHLTTRLYFEADPLNAQDPVLTSIPEPRRPTLLAHQTQPGTWTLDLRLQGDDETVWMAV